MGYAQLIDGVAFPTNIPRIPLRDALESPGGLVLIDPAHPAESWDTASTMPSSGSSVPNLFQDTAQTLVGSAVSLPTIQTSTAGAGSGKIGRTYRGAVYAQVASNTTGTCAVTFNLPTAILNYIKANRTHKFFLSIWTRTYVASTLSGAPLISLVSTTDGSSATNLFYLRAGVAPAYSSQYRAGEFDEIGNARSNALVDALPESIGEEDNYRRYLATTGTTMTSSVSNFPKVPVTAIHRVCLIDATVDGRTYAELDAIDATEFAAAFNNGRYAADSMR